MRSWRLHRRTDLTSTSSHGGSTRSCGAGCTTTARFYRSALYPLLTRINAYLMRWIRKKYKRLAAQAEGAREAWQEIAQRYPRCFAHWAWVTHAVHGLVTRTTRAV